MAENKNTPANLLWEDWGITEYGDAFEKQKTYVQDRLEGRRPDTLVFTEHLPVYTLGLRKGAEHHLLWNEEILTQKGISVYKTNRGGDITYHGPGQLTGYPIISLNKSRDLHAYLRLLEDMLIKVTGHYGIVAHRRDGKTGIWIGNRKIAAIGVAVKSWVAYHGFALNVTDKLEPFTGIVPCGIADGIVTSLEKETGRSVSMDEVKSLVLSRFSETFRRLLEPSAI